MLHNSKGARARGTQQRLGKNLARETLRTEYHERLEKAGLMDKIPHPTDGRANLHIVLSTDISSLNMVENGGINNPEIFTLEYLKVAFEKLKKIWWREGTFIIKNFDGRELTIEDLHRKFFIQKHAFHHHIDLSPIPTSEANTSENNTGNNKPPKTTVIPYANTPLTQTETTSSLQEDIKRFREVLAELKKERKGEAYPPSTVRERLGWPSGPKFGRVLKIVERDGGLFRPRPGFIKGVFD